MLSSITPLGERTRNNRWSTTVGWYIAGSTLGGLTFGVAGALGTVGARAIWWPAEPTLRLDRGGDTPRRLGTRPGAGRAPSRRSIARSTRTGSPCIGAGSTEAGSDISLAWAW